MKKLICVSLLALAAPAVAQPAPLAPPMQARTSANTYLQLAASSDAYEIQSSKLVLQSASNPDVRRFAEMMVSDHAGTTAQLMAAAKEASLGNPANIQGRQVSMLKALRSTPKAKRERAYVDQQVMSHQEALALHEGFAAQGDNPGLRSVAQGAVPIVRAHLAEIQRIQASMGGPMTSMRR